MSASYSWLGLSPMVWSLISVGIAVWRFYAMASAVPPTRAAAASGVAVRVGEEVKA
ncbi:hypothetical protein [Actinomyces naeslundii]|uniref:hypothetical protein n=1 Tax=Actinomyces naeslundii TaxID=1655 RepID=UPI0015C32BFE|nr:hypothetical protein [Actinomyces naeslundii]